MSFIQITKNHNSEESIEDSVENTNIGVQNKNNLNESESIEEIEDTLDKSESSSYFKSLLNNFSKYDSIQKGVKHQMDEKYKGYLKDKGNLKKDIILANKKSIEKIEIECDLSEKQKDIYVLQKKFVNAIPAYEALRMSLTKSSFDYLNHNADYMMERMYLDRNFFKKERTHVSLEKFDRFEMQIKTEQEKRRKKKAIIK